MKPFEPFISESDHILRAEEPILVHLDGVGMTRKYLRKMDEAERHTFSDCLLTTAKNLCKQAETALLAYTYSDEIVLLLAGDGAANPKTVLHLGGKGVGGDVQTTMGKPQGKNGIIQNSEKRLCVCREVFQSADGIGRRLF